MPEALDGVIQEVEIHSCELQGDILLDALGQIGQTSGFQICGNGNIVINDGVKDPAVLRHGCLIVDIIQTVIDRCNGQAKILRLSVTVLNFCTQDRKSVV